MNFTIYVQFYYTLVLIIYHHTLYHTLKFIPTPPLATTNLPVLSTYLLLTYL